MWSFADSMNATVRRERCIYCVLAHRERLISNSLLTCGEAESLVLQYLDDRAATL